MYLPRPKATAEICMDNRSRSKLLRYEAKVIKSVNIGHQVCVKAQAALYFCLFPVSASRSNFFSKTGEGNSWKKENTGRMEKTKSESQKNVRNLAKWMFRCLLRWDNLTDNLKPIYLFLFSSPIFTLSALWFVAAHF